MSIEIINGANMMRALKGSDDITFNNKLTTHLCGNKPDVHVSQIIKEFELKGIKLDDPRIKCLIKYVNNDKNINRDELNDIINSNEIIETAFVDDFVIKNFNLFTSKISDIYDDVFHSPIKGKVADYIPQLAKVNPGNFGVSICTIDGQRFDIGDTDIDFTLQSSNKIINYCIAYEQNGDLVHKYVGKDPSGVIFNAITLDDKGRPHNPCVNAGAIMTASLINMNEERDSSYQSDRFQYICDIYKKLMNNKIRFNNSIYLSEKETGFRNYALAYFMKEVNGFPKNTNLDDVLQFYFQCCSLESNTQELSILAATLANQGINPLTNERVFAPKTVKNCLNIMFSCGMYNYRYVFFYSELFIHSIYIYGQIYI